MSKKLAFLLIFFTIALGVLWSISQIRYAPPSTAAADLKQCLTILNIPQVDWRTIVLSSSTDISTTPDKTWDYFSQTDKWEGWSQAHLSRIQWPTMPQWEVGQTFSLTRTLGLPTGSSEWQATLHALERPSQVAWTETHPGIQACYLWTFSLNVDGHTLVRSVSVLYGTRLGVIKPLVANGWQRTADQDLLHFRDGVENENRYPYPY